MFPVSLLIEFSFNHDKNKDLSIRTGTEINKMSRGAPIEQKKHSSIFRFLPHAELKSGAEDIFISK